MKNKQRHANKFIDRKEKDLVSDFIHEAYKEKQQTCKHFHRSYQKNLVIGFIHEANGKTKDMQYIHR